MSDLDPKGTAPNLKAPEHELAARRWDELKSERAKHEADWEDIARLLHPERGGFTNTTPADRTIEKPLSSAPIMAQMNFSAGLYGTLTNPAEKWFSLQTNDGDANAWHENRVWLDLVADRIFRSFSPTVSPFYSAAHQLFGDMASFGTGAQYDEVVQSEGRILDVTLSLAEVCLDIDGFGRVNEVVRRFMLKPAAAVALFRGNPLPPRLEDLAAKGDQTRVAFYHHVLRNGMYQPRRIGTAGKRWLSRYTCEMEGCLIRQSGYDEMPFFAARWHVDTGAIYGIGPGFVALASTRTHMRMTEATLRRAQREADPTLLAPDKTDWALNGKARPGAVIYNGVNMQGNPMLRPLELGGQFSLVLQEKQQVMEDIRDAFHYSLMNLSGRTGMTATEVMAITEERQRLWAPHQGRVQEEYQAPKIARRFSMLWREGQLPPPPKGLQGLPLDIQYLSAAAAAQRSVSGNATMRVLQDITPLLQTMPSLGARLQDRLSPDDLLETLMNARGAPAAMVISRADADKLGQARAEAQQAMQAMQAAQAGAGMYKDVAGAQAQLAGAQQAGAPGGGS